MEVRRPPDSGPGVGGQTVLQDFHPRTMGPLLAVLLHVSLAQTECRGRAVA